MTGAEGSEQDREQGSAVASAVGKPVHAPDGTRIGVVTHAYRDDASGHPEWVSVRLDGAGQTERIVPVGPAQLRGERVEVAFDEDAVAGAPEAAGEHLSVDEQAQLVRHYGLDRTRSEPPTKAETARGSLADNQDEGRRPDDRLAHGSSAQESSAQE